MEFTETNLYDLTKAERISIVIAKMIVGTLSVVGSSLLIYNASNKLRRRQASTYHRLLIGMSVMDLLHSIFSGSLNIYMVTPDSGAWGATIGNTQSCAAQGFFTQMSIGAPLYNASLAIFFMITLLLGRRATQQLTLRMEPVLHFVPWSISLITATYGLSQDWYNALDVPEAGCWIEQYPLSCKYNEEIECRRGPVDADELLRVKWAMLLYPLWAVFGAVLLCNSVILYAVYIQERKNRRYNARRSERASKAVRATAIQSFLYVLVMIFTIMWFVLADISISFGNVSLSAIYPFHILFVLSYPSQGIFNYLVYIRRRLSRHRNEHKISYLKAFWQVSFPDTAQLNRLSTFWRRSSRMIRDDDNPFTEASSSVRRSTSMKDCSVLSSSTTFREPSNTTDSSVHRRSSTASIPLDDSVSKDTRNAGVDLVLERAGLSKKLLLEDKSSTGGGNCDDAPLQRSIRFADEDLTGLITNDEDDDDDDDVEQEEVNETVVVPMEDNVDHSEKQQIAKMMCDEEPLDKSDAVERGEGIVKKDTYMHYFDRRNSNHPKERNSSYLQTGNS